MATALTFISIGFRQIIRATYLYFLLLANQSERLKTGDGADKKWKTSGFTNNECPWLVTETC